MKKLNFALFALGFLLFACDTKDEIKNPQPKETIPVQDMAIISAMTNDFGWQLFQEVTKGVSDENVLISPVSVQTTLSMAVNGAEGLTQEEMLKVLGCPNCDVPDLNEQTALLRELMEEQSGHPTLISANGFFYDPGRLEVLTSFEERVSTGYRAIFQTEDFNNPVAKDNINNWVKANTGDRIDKIIDDIESNDAAFIVNALHFKADWAIGFHPGLTKPRVFTRADQSEVIVDFVNADRRITTTENSSFRMVDIPFLDSTYSFSMIIPQGPISATSDWVLSLTAAEVKEMWSSLYYDRADVSFPKLDIAYDIELKDPLSAMGMAKAFSPGIADFSNLGNSLAGGKLYVSKVRHKSVLKVDEKGAEGASVTSAGIAFTSAPPVFEFNRPFVLVLRHTSTNTILFAGLVNDPS